MTLRQEQGSIPQVAKLLSQIGNPNRQQMQRLIGGNYVGDLQKIDLTKITRFDFCRVLNIPMEFRLKNSLEVELEIDTEASIEELYTESTKYRPAGGDSIILGNLCERESSPTKASFFITRSKSENTTETYESTRLTLARYDLVPATTRELLTYIIAKDAMVYEGDFPSSWILCGMDVYKPAHYRHLVCTRVEGNTGKLFELRTHWSAEELEPGIGIRGYKDSWRHFLVRRMTHEEIMARLEPQKQ
jgi:hypothetical protein